MAKILDRFRPLFYPQSLAVIGASNTRGKWGQTYTRNLRDSGYAGKIYPVNPKESSVLGFPAYARLQDIPAPVDLALILLPPPLVPAAVEECLKKRVGAIVVITAGFGELGEAGRRMEEAFARPARAAGVPLIGPNCMGLVNVQANLNAQLFYLRPRPGKISILSQSGNLGGNLIRKGMSDQIGFAKFVSSGNEAVTTGEELLEYFAEDPETEVLLVYVEGVKDGRRFLDAARRLTERKPIVLLKGGSTEVGGKACASHTGAMAGEREVFAAVCRQAGILQVDDLDDLYYAGAALAANPLPPGDRIGIVTEGGGLGVIAADACAAQGLTVAPLPAEMIAAFDRFMPGRWSRNNPVDTAAGEGKFQALEIMIRSDYFDGIIQLGIAGAGATLQTLRSKPAGELRAEDRARLGRMEQRVVEEMEEAKRLVELCRETQKPIICADQVATLAPVSGNPVLEYLSSQGMLVCRHSSQAAKVMSDLCRYARRRRRGQT
jgi:acyl-CoA synthetase (NDP forming)